MVICKFFQSGNCRFGSKCVNEHFDVKQYIKSEVEAALKGSQWPLSCFGLFKEKPCIPNFIEDQSYEEVRFMCYKARKENYFPAYQQQFTQQVMEAQNKMKTLLTLGRDVVEAMIKLYDDAEIAQKGVTGQQQQQQQQHQQPQQQATSGNPFSMGSSAIGQSSSAGLFGSNPNQNPFANATTTFGGSNMGQASVFGGQATTPSTNILGQSAFASNGYGSNSIFGGQQTGSFSLNQNTGGQIQGGNIFSMNSAGNVVQQPQQQQPAPVFAPAANAFGVNSGQSSIFSQPVVQQQQAISGGNLFTQQNSSTTGAYSGFGQPQGNANFDTSQVSGIFGQQSQPQQQQQQQQFQLQQQQLQQQQQQQQSGGQNMFGHATDVQQGYQWTSNQNSAFVAPNQGQQNIFGQAQQNAFQQPSSTQAGSAVAVNFNDSVYSKMEELSAEEIEAFRAEEFILGKIPTNPPPRELVH